MTLLLSVAACGSDEPEDEGPGTGATAETTAPDQRSTELVDPEGSSLGTAWLRDADDRTEIELDVSGLPEGLQDVSLFETADCESVNPEAPVIALPALSVLEDGTGALTTDVEDTALADLLEGEGLAVVITDATVDTEAGAGSDLPDSYLACGVFSE